MGGLSGLEGSLEEVSLGGDKIVERLKGFHAQKKLNPWE
jgi:hypothetical protein